jgi:hypothetical protein
VKRLIKHIVILLLGIFLFPIAYQSLHTAFHHIHGYQNVHHCCKYEENKNPYPFEIDNSSQGNDSCPVCEYQFSVNDVSKASVFRPITPLIINDINEPEFPICFQEVFSYKSTRAPPSFLA